MRRRDDGKRRRVRRPQRHRPSPAGRSRHRRRDGLERPRCRAHGRGRPLASAASPTATACSSSSRRTGRTPSARRRCRNSPTCISRAAALRSRATSTCRRRPHRPTAALDRLRAAAPAGEPHSSRRCCSPTRSPRTTPSSATCATTSSPASLGCGAAFAINHGDVVFDDLSLYPRYLADPRRDRHSLAPLPRQPRHQLGGAATTATRARPGSACSARATTPSSTPTPPSSCSITCTTSATTPASRAAASIAA